MATAAPKAPPYPPVENIPPVIETAPGEPLPAPTPVTVAMTEKYGPKGPNRLTPEQLWALSPQERDAYLKSVAEAEAAEAAGAKAAPNADDAAKNAAAKGGAAAEQKPRQNFETEPRTAPDAPPYPPVENIPPVIETAPGEPLPATREMTVAMTEKYGPKGPNHKTPEELWALAGGRKEKEEGEEEGATGSDSAAGVSDAEASAVSADPNAAAAAKANASAGRAHFETQPRPAPDAPPYPPVENIPPVIETAPGELLPSTREMTVAMTEKYGPKGPNHRTPEELWRLAAESAEKATAEGAQNVASNVAVAAAESAAKPSRVPFVPEAPRPQNIPAVIQTAPGELLPSTREMTIAMTEKYGPKEPTRMLPAEIELRTGYRSKMPPAKDPAVGPGSAAASPMKGQAQGQAGAVANAPVAGQANAAKAGATTGGAGAGAGTKASPQAAGGAGAGTKASPQAAGGAKAGGAQSPSGGAKAKAGAASAAGGDDSKESMTSKAAALGNRLMQNKLFMSAFAVGAAALTVFSIYKGVEMYNRFLLKQAIADIQNRELSTVHLYIHHRSPLAPSISIPCTRVETFLRVAKIPYEAHCISDPEVSPDGHLPFIVYNNERIAGPQNIVDFVGNTFNVHLDNNLTDDQYATGVAVMKALQYSLVRGYMRSIHVERPEMIRPYYSEMNHTPDFITRLALSRLRANIERTNDTSGYNKLTSEQFQFELAKDAKAIETLLSKHEFLFTDDYPTSFDCALYAWLLPIVAMEDAADVNAVFEYIVSSESLTNFVKRMTELAFPDLDELVLTALEGEKALQELEQERQHPSQPPSRRSSVNSAAQGSLTTVNGAGGSAAPRRNSMRNLGHRERRASMSQRRQDLSRGEGTNSQSQTPSASAVRS